MSAQFDDAARERLQAFVARSAGARAVRMVSAKPLSGGAIQENWRVEFEVEGGPYAGPLPAVLRADAPTSVSVSHGRVQEFALLKAVFEAGVTVPEPLWACGDLAVLGRPFFIMRLVPGTADAQALTRDGSVGGDRRELARRIGREMALLHRIRPPRADLGLENPDGSPALRLVERARCSLDAAVRPHPALEWALRWLERHAPPRGDVVLCHRDLRTGNYMVDEHGLTAILDWEFAGYSDPMEDLGWFCARCWRFARPDLEAGGIGQRSDLYAGYMEAGGRQVDDRAVRYWEVMAHLNWAVIALQQAARHTSGEESSLLLALTGHIVPELEWELLRLTEAD